MLNNVSVVGRAPAFKAIIVKHEPGKLMSGATSRMKTVCDKGEPYNAGFYGDFSVERYPGGFKGDKIMNGNEKLVTPPNFMHGEYFVLKSNHTEPEKKDLEEKTFFEQKLCDFISDRVYYCPDNDL